MIVAKIKELLDPSSIASLLGSREGKLVESKRRRVKEGLQHRVLISGLALLPALMSALDTI